MNDLVPVPILKKGNYRHNKTGNTYEVLGVALETESGSAVVIYRPLYESDIGYELYSRPYDMFVEPVRLNGRMLPRFEPIDD